MSLVDAVKAILGIKPVRVGDVAAAVSDSRAVQHQPARHTGREGITDIEVIPEYQQLSALLDARAPLIFVTGGAGTGKSTLIRYLRGSRQLRLAVVAPTGVAALNAGGVTIHSMFRLPHHVIQQNDIAQVFDRRLYTSLDLLIVDEVSMVRPDLLDGVDRFLKLNRESDAPFGGVSVLLIGDLFQLPPVVPPDEHRALRELGYATDFFFGSNGIADCSIVPVFLSRVFRQSDPRFIALLNDVRESRNLAAVLSAINARCTGATSNLDHELVLTCTNDSADSRNRQELDRLHTSSRTYLGTISGEFQIEETRLPAPMNLLLKSGAQVMFTKNDDNHRWVNGTIGTVVDMRQHSVLVEIEERSLSQRVEVQPVTWEKYKYEYDPLEDRPVPKVVGRYSQIPLMLAWAVTIHKAQGRTLDRVLVDLGRRAFAPGQVYVALSRVRAMEDLRLARRVREEEVRCHSSVTTFYQQLGAMTRITNGESAPRD